MLSIQRQQNILDYIAEKESVQVKELGEVFNVSLATVRRDLALMEEQGKIKRVHGGAVYVGADNETEPPVQHRKRHYSKLKDRIGKEAANLVHDGETIIIASGTTAETMVPYLAGKENLTVITNAINVAYALASYPNINVIVLGGWLRHSEFSLLGNLTEHALQKLNADKVFYGVFGIDAEQGLTGAFLQEVQTDNAIISIARELIVVADHTKFDQVGPIKFASLDSVSTLITDRDAPADQLAQIEAMGITVIRA
jgi:DeoR/GlpR family transcriptional regulator of sugar metabolism